MAGNIPPVAAGVGVGAIGTGLLAIALQLTTPQVTQLEGVEYQAYRDVVGVLTVCAGHTGKDIIKGKTYTPEECGAMTEKDVKVHMDEVLKVSPHLIYHPMQLASATSFTYNVGGPTYQKSTVKKLFNAGDFIGACQYMSKYKYAGGKIVKGLENRRKIEVKLCMSTLTA